MIKKELIVARDPRAPISESFRAMRTNLQFMNSSEGNNQVILITSTSPSDGKTWISANIATTFAQAGKKTCIIDCDMRKGRLYSLFNIPPAPGVSNYLSGVNVGDYVNGIASFMQEVDMPNLYVIPAGNIPPNPSELLISPKMKKMLNELKELVDVIIVDGTPCDLVTDSTIVSRIVDQTIIVCAANHTKMEDLNETKKKIENAGGKVTGIVLNKIPSAGKKYEDRYYYGSTSRKK